MSPYSQPTLQAIATDRRDVEMYKLAHQCDRRAVWVVNISLSIPCFKIASSSWKNKVLGYWLNLVMVSLADIGFIIFVLIPGHIEIFPGILDLGGGLLHAWNLYGGDKLTLCELS